MAIKCTCDCFLGVIIHDDYVELDLYTNRRPKLPPVPLHTIYQLTAGDRVEFTQAVGTDPDQVVIEMYPHFFTAEEGIFSGG